MQQFVGILKTTFGREKLPGGNIQESNTRRFIQVNAGQEIIFPVFEHIIIQGGARCDQLGNAPFNDRFRDFGILELFADGNPLSGPDQSREDRYRGHDMENLPARQRMRIRWHDA